MDKIQELEACGIEASASIKRLLNKENIYFKYLLKFTEDASYDRLLSAFENGSCEEAFRAAHTLRGTAGNMGAEPMHRILIDMTEALRAGELDSQRPALAELVTIHDTLCREIRRILQPEYQ